MNYLQKLQSNFPTRFRFRNSRYNVKYHAHVAATIKFCQYLVHLLIARKGRLKQVQANTLKKKNVFEDVNPIYLHNRCKANRNFWGKMYEKFPRSLIR